MNATRDNPVSPRDDANTHNKSKFANSVEHPVFRVIAILATITTVSLGVRTWWFSDANGANQSGAVPSTAVPSTAVPSTAAPSTTTVAASTGSSASATASFATTSPADTPASVVAVGDCLNDGGSIVPCTAIHRTEVIATSAADCNDATATEYLGGNRELDVLRAHVAVGNDMSCLVSAADNTDLSSPIKGTLDVSKGSAGDSFRLCRDDRTAATNVGCGVPHTGEYVGVPAGTVPDQRGCEAAAQRYLNLSVNEVSDRLAVTVLPTSNPDDGQPRCVITVRGNQILNGSIRNVRTNALPLAAG